MVASLDSEKKTDKYNIYPLKIVIRFRWDCVLKNVWQKILYNVNPCSYCDTLRFADYSLTCFLGPGQHTLQLSALRERLVALCSRLCCNSNNSCKTYITTHGCGRE